jgi:thiamine biosynthesis lipoprotein
MTLKDVHTMQRRTLLWAALGALPFTTARSAGLQWHARHLQGLGTHLHLQVAHAQPEQAEKALSAAQAVLREIEDAMSLFQADSELQRLNRDGRLAHPSGHLLAVLREAQWVARHSRGAFDVTVQPLWLLSDAARQAGRLPTAAERAQALSLVGWQGLKVADQAVELARPGMAVTLNGIAQGYAADAVRATLQAHGVEHALVDTGEFGTLGCNPHGRAWTLGVEDPHRAGKLIAALALDGNSLATSADNRSAFTPDHRHHHIFDPSTGDSPTVLSSITVAARSAMRADALTKVMFMAQPALIPQLAQRWQVGVLWVDKQGRWGATRNLRLA